MGKMPGPNETYEFDTLSDWYHGMDQPSILDITISIDASVTVELNRHLKFPLISKDCYDFVILSSYGLLFPFNAIHVLPLSLFFVIAHSAIHAFLIS